MSDVLKNDGQQPDGELSEQQAPDKKKGGILTGLRGSVMEKAALVAASVGALFGTSDKASAEEGLSFSGLNAAIAAAAEGGVESDFGKPLPKPGEAASEPVAPVQQPVAPQNPEPAMPKPGAGGPKSVGGLNGEVKPMPEVESANRVQPSAGVLEAAEKVREGGWYTIDHGYDANNPYEKGVRGPSIVKPLPISAVPEPVIFSQKIVSNGGGDVVMAMPRDVADQFHVATKILVHNERGEQVPCDIKFTYTHTPNDDARYPTEEQYSNPLVIVYPKAAGELTVRGLHWFVRPKYPPVTPAAIASALDRESLVTLQRAIQAGTSLPVGDANRKHFWDFENVTVGHCYERGYLAKKAGNESGKHLVEVMGGYADVGGAHGNNLATTSAGLVTFDPQPSGLHKVGMLDKFIATELGSIHQIDELDNFRLANIGAGTHGGLVSADLIKISIPGDGDDGAQLGTMLQKMQYVARKVAAARGRLDSTRMSAEEKEYCNILQLGKELYEWREDAVYSSKLSQVDRNRKK